MKSNSAVWKPVLRGMMRLGPAVALVAFAQGPAIAAPAPAPQAENLCLQVKDPAARKLCQDSRQQFSAHNYRASLVTMRNALKASPKDSIIHALLARIVLQLNDLGGAERELRTARQAGVDDHIVLPVLFKVMVDRHEEIKLLNEFAEPVAGARGGATADVWAGRALALLSLERTDEAARAMDQALALNRDATGLLLRAKIATGKGDTVLAGKLIEDAWTLDPQNNAVMSAKIKALEESNDNAATLAFADKMLKAFPFSGDARIARIKTYLKMGDDAKAKMEINALLDKAPGSPIGTYYKAVMMARGHDKRGAAQAIQTLPREFVQQHPEYGLEMAQMLSDNGADEAAAATLGSALSVRPDMVDLRLKLASLRMRQNSPQSALLVLTPVQDSKDARVQGLLRQVKARIAKDRAF